MASYGGIENLTATGTQKPRASRPRPFLSLASFPLPHRPGVDNQPLNDPQNLAYAEAERWAEA
jgi:hypothetical protein